MPVTMQGNMGKRIGRSSELAPAVRSDERGDT
jgi:hypothetical protein